MHEVKSLPGDEGGVSWCASLDRSPSQAWTLTSTFSLVCLVCVYNLSRSLSLYFFPFKKIKVPTRDVETGETGTEQCRAMLGCFLFIFYQGLAEAGNILTVLSKVSPGTHVYQSRIVYDSIFVVWVSIVLLNIITGLMVQKASKQRMIF
jgi:hypothetical protein